MDFLKTNGIGWSFTENEAEALILDNEPQAEKLANRLKKQHLKQHTWEVVPCAKGYRIVVTSPKANRAKIRAAASAGEATQTDSIVPKRVAYIGEKPPHVAPNDFVKAPTRRGK